MRTEELNTKLEAVVKDRPALRHVLDLRIVTRAVVAAVLVAMIVWLLIGPATAAVALLLVYFGTWLLLARVEYDRRRETQRVDRQPATDSGR
jgi:Flp pilus assembly protein TadB